jgi:hypothetical protein
MLTYALAKGDCVRLQKYLLYWYKSTCFADARKCVHWLGSPKSQDLFKGFDWVSPYYSPGISFRLRMLQALLQLCCRCMPCCGVAILLPRYLL